MHIEEASMLEIIFFKAETKSLYKGRQCPEGGAVHCNFQSPVPRIAPSTQTW